MRRLNGWLTIFWVVMIPVSYGAGLVEEGLLRLCAVSLGARLRALVDLAGGPGRGHAAEAGRRDRREPRRGQGRREDRQENECGARGPLSRPRPRPVRSRDRPSVALRRSRASRREPTPRRRRAFLTCVRTVCTESTSSSGDLVCLEPFRVEAQDRQLTRSQVIDAGFPGRRLSSALERASLERTASQEAWAPLDPLEAGAQLRRCDLEQREVVLGQSPVPSRADCQRADPFSVRTLSQPDFDPAKAQAIRPADAGRLR